MSKDKREKTKGNGKTAEMVVSRNGPEEQSQSHPQQRTEPMDRKTYEKELAGLQIELVKLQEWIRTKGLKVVVIFEGRDAAGKGGAIKRITESLNPRVCRVVALGTPDRAREDAVVFPALCRRTCPRPARWCCSTAAGTTAPASSG